MGSSAAGSKGAAGCLRRSWAMSDAGEADGEASEADEAAERCHVDESADEVDEAELGSWSVAIMSAAESDRRSEERP